jgi:NAD(P)-dependent dehydrogenase (short-subunit alcohol dehydrogenase family)
MHYRFGGRVAIVTGAARGLGRAHARLLAERGASVVVNDVGGSVRGEGVDPEPAREAAAEIVDAGGVAISNGDDIATVEGASAAVAAALEQFGRIDIVVNNAGIYMAAGPSTVDLHNLERHLAVHVVGSFNTAIAAWPHMERQGYGRIVMTTSTGIFGLPGNLSYAAAKAAVIGMCRSMAGDAPDGIKVNVIAPNGQTRLGIDPDTDKPFDWGAPASTHVRDMPPELVSPVVAYLAHESCPVNGEVYVAGGGRVGRIFTAMTKCYAQPSGGLTIEDVAENWAAINDETGYHIPTSTLDAGTHLFSS